MFMSMTNMWTCELNQNKIDIRDMQIETWLSPTAVGPHERGRVRVAVVIDVLRATTVATTAIAAGARSVTTCLGIDEARALQRDCQPDCVPLLCGERECKPIEGFDFGNSPSEYSPAGVGERDLVMTTTNGTRAIDAAADCDVMLLACFANLTAVADAIIAEVSASTPSGALDSEFVSCQPPSTSGRVRIVCAGTNGAVTSEDVLLAGALIAVCHRKLSDTARFYDGPIELVNDSGSIALAAWQHCVTHDKVVDSESLSRRLGMTGGGQNLIAAGYENDLVDCASIDVFDQVPCRDQLHPPRFIGR
ncbi:putative 2-phosphosulfolactate phosphatase [Allorhodopirellula heiligendammensis]|uniref:Probable 2-phosphosulfolactate phosphatase n=2 Tax=Allorhodopirellula heiligendammensis TaxID=2714739 RepID=A0A5C6BY71_9BACT|nr:putative 2-phosphosulfolactate phosphatase [Allorhodopirellula heiligendammensis]